MKNQWKHYVSEAFEAMITSSDTRELGKLLAIPNEYMQRDWINHYTDITVHRRENAEECDGNQSGYDLLSDGGLTINSKFRSKTIHLENTRRVSKKNIGSASRSGHVAYSLGECDVYCFTRPHSNYRQTDMCELVAIPEVALEDPKNPGYLVRSVPLRTLRKWEGKTKEVLESAEKQKREKGRLLLESFNEFCSE
jgi:hypothetical protein